MGTDASEAAIRVLDGDQRFHTRLSWLDSRHTFNFDGHYRPDNSGHGLLVVCNDDIVAPGTGFGAHPHRDMEIVTWVLEGRLAHHDSEGHSGVIGPGEVQRMSAGTGIRHSEMNPDPDLPVHFVQMWVVPDRPGHRPGYEQLDVNGLLEGGSLVAVASGRGHPGAVHIHQPGAVMWVARMAAGDEIELPDAPLVHCFVARGSVMLAGRRLEQGSEARCAGAGPVTVRAASDGSDAGSGIAGPEIIVWESSTGR